VHSVGVTNDGVSFTKIDGAKGDQDYEEGVTMTTSGSSKPSKKVVRAAGVEKKEICQSLSVVAVASMGIIPHTVMELGYNNQAMVTQMQHQQHQASQQGHPQVVPRVKRGPQCYLQDLLRANLTMATTSLPVSNF
jgi:hypothetical protein